MPLTSMLERNIQIELYRIFKNIIEEKFSYNGIEFVDVKYEPRINGRPDLVVEAVDKGKRIALLVIETKRKVPFIDRKFDPYSIDVIRQASGYAVELGAPYFATCNGDVLVLFDTFTAGVPLPQRRLKHYKVTFDEEFTKTLLEDVCKFRIGVGKWLELDDVFLQRLRTFHSFITPYILESLNQQLREDLKFKDEYVRWLKSQLFEYSPEMNQRIAEQLAYMLMNRLTFYKTLETQITSIPKLAKIETEDPKEFSDMLRSYFNRVYKEVDYEAIFEPHPILDQIPFSKKLVYALNEFIEELGTYNLAKIRSDVIGRVYEELIPDVERHRLGQYYTPPPIVELITEMCIRSASDKVLDPACGSGSFLVKAYHKLKDLKKKENPFTEENKLHEELLNQLYGVDINPFPAQLSSINLAIRNLKVASRHINLIVSDFFKVKPSMGIIPEVDVVVTNPPYTRQEEMEYKEQIREEALTYSDGSRIDLSAQAGIYAYFFTHSSKFLKNGGRMGYITSNTWLDVAFGEGLKKFFLDHLKILAIIEHDAGVFEKAVVDTSILILEKAEGELLKKEREWNDIKFIRIKKPMEIKDLIKFIEEAKEDYEDDKVRIVLRKQGFLEISEKWGKYLRAPKVYYKIMENPIITKLGDIANIRRGYTTGAEEFFYLDKDQVKLWNIEQTYYKPVITNPRKIQHPKLSDVILDEYLLTVYEPKDALQGTNVIKYIEHGESRGYHLRQTTKTRKMWYSLAKREPSPIIIHRFIRERIIVAWNDVKAAVDDSFYEIAPNNEKDTLIILGYLNSSILSLIMELHGRLYGAGLFEIKVYELRKLPVINPIKLRERERNRISEAFIKYCEAKSKGDKKLQKEARQELDDVIFDVLGLTEDERRQVYEGLESLRRMRLQRKEVEVLVETAEKWKPVKKPRKERIKTVEPSKRLDVWIKQ